MTKEEALSLTIGDEVYAHKSAHAPDEEVESVFGTIVTVKDVGNYNGEVLVDVLECASALYWDEVEFIQELYIDDNEEYDVGNLSDLLQEVL